MAPLAQATFKENFKECICQTLDKGKTGCIKLDEMQWVLNKMKVNLPEPQFYSLVKSSKACFVKYAELVDEIFDDGADKDANDKKTIKAGDALGEAPNVTGQSQAIVDAKKSLKAHPSLGIIRLDYDYPPAPGDIDHTGSFMYDVYYRAVPGLKFDVCQSGKMSPKVEEEWIKAINWLDQKGVKAISGDCGFMMWFQHLTRKHTRMPVCASSLAQLPAVTCAFSSNELIAILTANGKTLEPMHGLIKEECGVDPKDDRYVIVGCEDVPGFEAVALGEKVDTVSVTPGIIKKVQDTIKAHPNIRAILMECTELPPYSDAVRAATGLPVFDAITCCDFFVRAFIDNPRFGSNDWQQEWDQEQEEYQLGKHLDEVELKKLQTKAKPKAKAAGKKTVEPKPHNDGKQHPSLGVIRLDYDYPAAPGDIDCPASFAYDVYYRCVPGLTFDICQAGTLSKEFEAEFIEAIQYLDSRGVEGITGDCGFMMWFQELARKHIKKPIFMSALVQLPAVTSAFGPDEYIAIVTANGKTLEPMHDLIKKECGVDPEADRYVIVGCEDVPGFEAVALGEKVDTVNVTPGIVKKIQDTIRAHPNIRAILMECTELPPYSDAVRQATGLPVFDAITCCDMFLNGVMDNPLFGLNNWHAEWDRKQEEYKLGQNLDEEDKAKLVNK